MSNTDRNNNLDTKSNHRKHKSLAALDTSNPNYKIFNISKKKSHSRLTSNGRNKKLNHKSFDIKPHNYSFEKTENLNEKSFNSIPSRIHSFDPCVENRDCEIERLNRLLDGGRSHDVVTLEGTLRNNEKVISHQNIQIEYLQDKNQELEFKLKELIDAKRQICNEKHRNDDLNRGIKQIKKATEIEKQLIVNAADRELEAAKYETHRFKEDMCTLDLHVKKIEKDNTELENQINFLKSELEQRHKDINNYTELIAKIQDDKCKQSKKITKMLENERELVTELDAIKNGKNRTTSCNRTNTKSLTAKLDSHIKNIENERDFFKQEVDTLQKLLRASQLECKHFASLNPLNFTSTTFNHRSRKDTNCQPVVKTSSSSKSSSGYRSSPSKSTKGVSQSPVMVKMCSSSTSPLRNISSNFDEVRVLKRERDELQILLEKFEIHMSEIQANVQMLTSERDRYSQMYEEAQIELQATKRDIIKSQGSNARSVNASLAANSVLKRAENERDIAVCELKAITNERDVIKERFKFTTENFIKEKASLEQQIEDLQVMLKNNEQEKAHMCEQSEELRCELGRMEEKLREKNFHLAQTTQDLNDQKSTSTQIRILAEESERALDDQQRHLQFKNDELHEAEKNIYKLEQKLYDLQDLNKTLKDEINNLRSTISSLDREKDKLMNNVDEKTVENVGLKQDLATKNKCLAELKEQLSQLETICDRASDENKQKHKEITALRIQLDRTNETNAEMTRRVDAGCRENKRLQEDLITITRENQVIHCELDKSNSDKDHLKEQLSNYGSELNKLQEMLNQKEHDRSSLLEQYRVLSNELNSMKITLTTYESDSNNMKIEIQMKNNDNKRLRERHDVLERDLHSQLNACQEYEVKLSGANRCLQRLEETFKKLQAENKDLAQDLMNTREMGVRLEQAKEELMRQLTSKELDCEQIQNELSDKLAENDLLKSQLNSERGMVKNLEDLIACNREKDFQIQLSTQERDSEIKLLKDRICLSEQKIQSQNKEITVLRNKLLENESDFERIKRQLTNERFEREKCVQELRKYQDSNINNEVVSRFNSRCHSPTRTCTVQLTTPVPVALGCSSSSYPHSSGGAAAAVAAARAAIDASNQASLISNGYRSISPVRSCSPYKESRITSNLVNREMSPGIRYSMHYDTDAKINFDQKH